MSFFTIQSVFLFYSAVSIFCGLLLLGLFWGRKDIPAKIWIASCFLSSLATMVTVYRDHIPLQISYSLMVSIETTALLLLSQSLWSLLPGYKAGKGIAKVLGFVACFFVLQEMLRYFGGGKLTHSMSLLTACAWVCVDLFCSYSALRVAKHFQNRLFLNLMSIIFFFSGLLFLLRVINMLTGYGYSAFDPQTYNFIIYFGIAILSSFRNMLYIILRMHLGFAEHGRLHNMNMQLTNILEERDQMIASLAKLNKSAEVNALASTIAHEVNQPLGASKLDAQFISYVLKEGLKNPLALEEAIKSLVSNIDRASGIIRNLSNLSRRSHVVSQVLNINQLLLDVVQISKGRCRKLGIEIELNAPEDCTVYANEGELQQVFINLINNAIDELEIINKSAGKITIAIKKVSDAIQICVQDNGRGVPANKVKTIFELLHTDKDGGSGIGLWLSQNIVGRIEGKIWYEPAVNEGVVSGSVFVVQLRNTESDIE